MEDQETVHMLATDTSNVSPMETVSYLPGTIAPPLSTKNVPTPPSKIASTGDFLAGPSGKGIKVSIVTTKETVSTSPLQYVSSSLGNVPKIPWKASSVTPLDIVPASPDEVRATLPADEASTSYETAVPASPSRANKALPSRLSSTCLQ